MPDKPNANTQAMGDFASIAEFWIDVPRSGVEEQEPSRDGPNQTEVRLPKGFTQGGDE